MVSMAIDQIGDSSVQIRKEASSCICHPLYADLQRQAEFVDFPLENPVGILKKKNVQ